MLVQEEMQAEATLFCGFVIILTYPGTQIRLCGLAHLTWQFKKTKQKTSWDSLFHLKEYSKFGIELWEL